MTLSRDKLFEVEGQEIDPDFDNKITIKHIKFLIWAPDIITACKIAEDYFGMGIRIVVTKCKQVN